LTERPKVYTEYVGLFLKAGTTEKLVALAKTRGHFNDEDCFGKKLKQPKRGVSVVIREIVEEYINRSLKP
jgi:hypothetical protein